jgi:hypothetical protein
LAAKVLWAGLKLAWETGIAPLRKAWESFRYFFERVGINAFAALQKAWLGVSNWMWKNFPETTAFIAKTWVNLAGTLKGVWARFQNWLSDRWLEIMGLFDEDLDVDLAKKLGREDLNAQLNQIEADRNAALVEADRKAGRSDAEREVEHAAALAGVEAERVQALAKLDKAHAERVAAAEQALSAAKAELANARQQAKKEREQSEAGPGAPKPGGLADLEQRVKAAAQATQAKISVVGTFNAAGVLGLAGSGVFDRTARAAEATAKNTRQIVDAVRHGGARFA